MRAPTSCGPKGQRGATLFVGLIMLVLITLMVVTALNLSSSNAKAVGNMQFREEAIAAANAAIDIRVASTFNAKQTTATTEPIDIDGNGTTDYTVTVSPPVCTKALLEQEPERSSESLLLPTGFGTRYIVDFDVAATVNDSASTGARIVLHSGVRTQLTASEKTAVCD
jgi:hypothetical protein